MCLSVYNFFGSVFLLFFFLLKVPVAVDSIPDHRHHPVRVGISDAFVMWHRNPLSLVLFRIFYVYSQVNISKKSVVNGSAVIFHPLRSEFKMEAGKYQNGAHLLEGFH